jgi:hypothetical protein
MKLNRRFSKEEVIEKFKDSWNDLFNISLKYNSTKLNDPECTHYIKCYWEFFKNLRTQDIKILEIGVKDGDSLKIWRDFFSKESSIFGIEINPKPLINFSQKNTEIFFGDQTDVLFLSEVVKKIGKVDIIIDDGGHTQDQLKTSFEFLFKYGLKEGGIYVMEDLGASYWYRWSGGLNNKNSIINFLKEKMIIFLSQITKMLTQHTGMKT